MRFTEKEIIKMLYESVEVSNSIPSEKRMLFSEQYKPLLFNEFDEDFVQINGIKVDAVVKMAIENGPSFKAVLEVVPVATPKNVTQKSRLLLDYLNKSGEPDLVPAIVAPYIAAKQAKLLAEEGISWIDLSGNMIIQVQGKIYIERTGRPNKFPDTAVIKKIFQGTSSLVSRALLLKKEGFSSLYEIVDFINARNASITLSTVSKVLKSLEEELLISRSKSLISVTQTGKLLDKLVDGYREYKKRVYEKKYKFAAGDINKLLYSFFERQIYYAACGFYAARLKNLAITEQITIFVRDIGQVKKAKEANQLKIMPDSEFGNIEIIETRSPCVWFNSPTADRTGMRDELIRVVDDIELYLEMMVDTPRGPKIAEVLRERILKGDTNG